LREAYTGFVATEGRATTAMSGKVWRMGGTTTKVVKASQEGVWKMEGMSLTSHSTTLALKPRGLCLGE
jgi:hypothetical protein